MALSLQGPSDNPKDSDEWKLYPSDYDNKKKEVGSGFEFEKCEIPTEHEVCLTYKITFFLHRNYNYIDFLVYLQIR